MSRHPSLSVLAKEILVFERLNWRAAGAKEQAIRDVFAMTPTRYYAALNAVLDNPAAYAEDPVLVGRLRRLRDARVSTRVRHPAGAHSWGN